MAESVRSRRAFVAIFAILIALHAALFATARLYPFVDLPEHLAAATIARSGGDTSSELARYYRVETLFEPNTFHLLFCGLRVFPTVELANRLYLLLYSILLPLSMLLIVRRAGGNPWFSLLSFLVMYNINVSWGFVGFALGVPLVLLFYRYFILEPNGLSTAPRCLIAAAALLALFFVHLLAALFALLVLGLSLLWPGRRTLRGAARAAAVAAPLVGLVAIWWGAQGGGDGGVGLGTFLSAYYPGSFIETLPQRWAVLAFDNARLYAGSAGGAVALLFSLGIVVPAIVLWALRVGEPRGEARGLAGVPAQEGVDAASAPRKDRGARGLAAGATIVAPLVAASLLCVLLLPDRIPRQRILYERFAPLFLLSLATVSSTLARKRGRRLFAVLATALCAIHFTLWADYFISFNRENAAFDAAFLPDAAGSRTLAGLVYDDSFRGRPIYIHFPSYYIVWKGGVTPAALIDYRFGPVRRRMSEKELPEYLEWVGRCDCYDGRYSAMDYLLVRGDLTAKAEPYLSAFAPVREAGRWRLYERRDPAR